MDQYTVIEKRNKQKHNNMKEIPKQEIEQTNDTEYQKLDEIYDECLNYLNENTEDVETNDIDNQEQSVDVDYESIDEIEETYTSRIKEISPKMVYKIENEQILNGSITSVVSEPKSDRLRKLSQQLPKIIITQSNSSLNVRRHDDVVVRYDFIKPSDEKEFERNDREEKMLHVPHWKKNHASNNNVIHTKRPLNRARAGYGDFPKRLVSKRGVENVALISNVPFEKIRMLNDTFHTLINLRWRWTVSGRVVVHFAIWLVFAVFWYITVLAQNDDHINLRWRWIVSGTVVVHFAIWLVFAVFWYITALAHYDFEPDPPRRTCVTGGRDFLTIFLASVEAQTTIGFGDRAIDEECPESIFLFIMQLILGTGLSGVLTCVVYAKLTRPEKLSRDGVGFSKNAVVCVRDGQLCLMLRAWDLNHDHIISSQFTAHFIHTHRTKEGEVLRFYASPLQLQQRQLLLWPVTLVHVIDRTSPLYAYGPEHIANTNYEITVSLKGASASMGTFTQSQGSYLPKEVLWGHRFPPVVKYDRRKQKYVIDHKRLDATEPVDTPFCSAQEYYRSQENSGTSRPDTPSSFSEKISSFHLGRTSSFRNKLNKG